MASEYEHLLRATKCTNLFISICKYLLKVGMDVLKKLRNCMQSWYLRNKFGRSFQNICIYLQKLCEYSLKVGTDVVAKLKRLYAKLVPLYQVWYKATKCSRFLKHWGFCLPTNLTSNVPKFGTHMQAQAQIPHHL